MFNRLAPTEYWVASLLSICATILMFRLHHARSQQQHHIHATESLLFLKLEPPKMLVAPSSERARPACVLVDCPTSIVQQTKSISSFTLYSRPHHPLPQLPRQNTATLKPSLVCRGVKHFFGLEYLGELFHSLPVWHVAQVSTVN